MADTLEKFPCFYTFKVFGRRSAEFVERVRALVGATLGEIPSDSMKVRESQHGRYVSVSIFARVESREQLARVYEDLRADEEVILYI